MALDSGVTSANISASRRRRELRIACNRRADYLARINAAPDNRMKIARAAEAVRAVGKDLDDATAAHLVQALLALAGLSHDETLNAAASQLIELARAA